MITLEENQVPDEDWNKRMENAGLATIYQTKEISNYYSLQDIKPKFLKFLDDKGKIVAQLVIFESSRFAKKGKKGKILKNIPKLKKKIYRWSYGPIILDTKCSNEVYSVLGNYLKSENCIVSGSQHPLQVEGIAGLDIKSTKWSTFLIDLHNTEKQLYENIDKHSGRKNIERSIRRDVIVEKVSEKNLDEFLELHRMYREKRLPSEEEYQGSRDWWKILQPLGYSGFIAKRNDTPVGGIMFSFYNKFIIEGGVARSAEDSKLKLYSQDLIKWRIIEWGLNNKMNYFNLAGFNPNPQSQKEEGILRYKEKWGGKRYDYWKILLD